MNGVLADKISMYLLGENESLYYIKIKYYLESVIGELEKLVMLLIIFSLFGYTAEIIIIMTVMLILRPYVGGTHFKSYWMCFGYTALVCAVAVVLGEVLDYNVYAFIGAFVLMLAIILFIAPVKSEFRPRYVGKLRMKIKARAIFNLVLILMMEMMFIEGYEMLIASVLGILCLDAGVSASRKGI